MILNEPFRAIESSEFRFRANQAAGPRIFRRIVEDTQEFHALLRLAKDRIGALQILKRIFFLASFETDIRYENPHDATLGVYLLALDAAGSNHASMAAFILETLPRLWWARNIAGEIAARDLKEPDAEVTHQEVTWPHQQGKYYYFMTRTPDRVLYLTAFIRHLGAKGEELIDLSTAMSTNLSADTTILRELDLGLGVGVAYKAN